MAACFSCLTDWNHQRRVGTRWLMCHIFEPMPPSTSYTKIQSTCKQHKEGGARIHLQDLTSASKMDVRSTCKRALGKPNHLHVYASRTDLTSLLPVDIFTPRRLLQPCKRTITSTRRSIDSPLQSSPDPPTPPAPTPTSLVVLSCQTNRAVK